MGHRFQLPVAAMIGAALCALPPRADAQYAETKLLASDAECGDGFGYAVAIDGDLAVIAAPFDEVREVWDGSAYVLRRVGTTWVQEDKLVSPIDSDGAFFGLGVGVSGDTVFVGDPYGDTSVNASGAVYVYHKQGTRWEITQILEPSDAHVLGRFGITLAVKQDVLAVGQVNDSNYWFDERGAVYLFRRTGGVWAQEQRVSPPDLDNFAQFGLTKIAVSGDVLAVGAPQEGERAFGAVYVFRRTGTTWIQEQKLIPPPNQGWGLFPGPAVAVQSDNLVVGSAVGYLDSPLLYPGLANVYRFDGISWILLDTLLPPSPERLGYFGISVALRDGRLLIGALDAVPGAPGAGSAYLYHRNGLTWSFKTRLTASEGAESDLLGWGLALDDSRGIVGAYGRDDADPEDPSCGSGAAYIYEIPVDCNDNTIPDDEELASGMSLDCNGNDIPDECDIRDCDQNLECADCNSNAIPDGCEHDCDRDGIPDDCEGPCPFPTGACCTHDPFDGCRDGATFFDCTCATCDWTQDTACEDVECPVNAIPSVGGWGLVVLLLLLLTGAKTHFGTKLGMDSSMSGRAEV